MQSNGEDILSDIAQQIGAVRRKSLLPWWIKVFMWIFLFLGALAPVGLIFGLLGNWFHISLYGLVMASIMPVFMESVTIIQV
jgi:hypothetical protein